MSDTRTVLAKLWNEQGHDPAALANLDLTGHEPVLPSSFAVGTAMQASVAASALAAAEIWRARTGRAQRVGVDMRAAAIAARSERYLTVDGGPAPELWDKIAGTYQCGDGRYVRLHTNFPHHRDGVLKLLGCANDKAAVAAGAAPAGRRSTSRTRRRRPSSSSARCAPSPNGMRIRKGRRSRGCRLLSIEQIGDAPAPRWPQGVAAARRHQGARSDAHHRRPGVRPDARRARRRRHAGDLAQPAVGGAAGHRHRPRQAVDVTSICTTPKGRAAFEALLREADVVVQGYRPGGLAALGYGPEDAARIRPGIVYVSLCAYSHEGPWANRRGFDSLVQTASGFNAAEAEAAGVDGPEAAAGAGARSCHRLPDGVRRDDRAPAPRPRGRQLARARLAGADRLLAALARPRRWPRHQGPGARRRRSIAWRRAPPASAACRRCAIRRHCRRRRRIGRGRRCRSARIRRCGRARVTHERAWRSPCSMLQARKPPSASSPRCWPTASTAALRSTSCCRTAPTTRPASSARSWRRWRAAKPCCWRQARRPHRRHGAARPRHAAEPAAPRRDQETAGAPLRARPRRRRGADAAHRGRSPRNAAALCWCSTPPAIPPSGSTRAAAGSASASFPTTRCGRRAVSATRSFSGKSSRPRPLVRLPSRASRACASAPSDSR